MKGIVRRKWLAAGLGLGLVCNTGCLFTGQHYFNLVDPCWPERYNAQARTSVVAHFGRQVENGHILDQTVFNYHFEYGTDVLHPAGLDKLDYLIRRRPTPDGRLFLATARDIVYKPEEPEKYATARKELDTKREQAIQKYLAAQSAGRPLAFEVVVHDPHEPNQHGTSARQMILGARGAAVGTLNGGAGVQVPGGGGGGGGAAAVAGPGGAAATSGGAASGGTGGSGGGRR